MFSQAFHRKSSEFFLFPLAAFLLFLTGCVATPVATVGPAKKSVFLKNPYAKNLVVFVHGIDGDPISTWTHDEGGDVFYWPKGLVEDSAYNRADVLSFGYESVCGSLPDVAGISRQLQQTLNELLGSRDYESISFVAHSTGGWIVRQFILDQLGDLVRQVRVENIVTLGTPGLSGNLQKVATFVCKDQGNELLKAGGFLDALNDRWRERFIFSRQTATFQYSAGYELVPVISVGKIVDKDSATYLSHSVQGLMKNHTQLTMPNGHDDPVYIWVRQQLQRSSADPRLRQYADAESVRIEEVIRLLQSELHGTDLKPVLSWIDHGDLDEALAFLYSHEAKESPVKMARGHFVRGQLYELKLDYRNALENYKAAIQLTPGNVGYLKEAGVLSLISGDYESANQYFQKAADGDLKTLGSNHPDIAAHWNHLGDTARRRGDNAEAIVYYQKARDGFLKTIGPYHPLMAKIWSNLGWVQYSNGDYDGAIASWEKATEGDLRNWGENHPNLARNLNHLGSAWMARGEVDKAIAYYEKAMQSDIKNFGLNHADVAMGWSQLGDAVREKGNNEKATEYYEKAASGFLAAYGFHHPNVAVQWENLGSTLRARGDYDRAIEYYEKALESNRKNLGSGHAQVARDLNNLGAVWSSKRDYDRAIVFFEEARDIFKKNGMTRSSEKVEKNLSIAVKNKSLKNPVSLAP